MSVQRDQQLRRAVPSAAGERRPARPSVCSAKRQGLRKAQLKEKMSSKGKEKSQKKKS